MSSMDMNMTIVLRRTRKPDDADGKRMALKTQIGRQGYHGDLSLRSLILPFGQDDRSDDGHEEQNRGDFKRQQEIGEQEPGNHLRIAQGGHFVRRKEPLFPRQERRMKNDPI